MHGYHSKVLLIMITKHMTCGNYNNNLRNVESHTSGAMTRPPLLFYSMPSSLRHDDF